MAETKIVNSLKNKLLTKIKQHHNLITRKLALENRTQNINERSLAKVEAMNNKRRDKMDVGVKQADDKEYYLEHAIAYFIDEIFDTSTAAQIDSVYQFLMDQPDRNRQLIRVLDIFEEEMTKIDPTYVGPRHHERLPKPRAARRQPAFAHPSDRRLPNKKKSLAFESKAVDYFDNVINENDYIEHPTDVEKKNLALFTYKVISAYPEFLEHYMNDLSGDHSHRPEIEHWMDVGRTAVNNLSADETENLIKRLNWKSVKFYDPAHPDEPPARGPSYHSSQGLREHPLPPGGSSSSSSLPPGGSHSQGLREHPLQSVHPILGYPLAPSYTHSQNRHPLFGHPVAGPPAVAPPMGASTRTPPRGASSSSSHYYPPDDDDFDLGNMARGVGMDIDDDPYEPFSQIPSQPAKKSHKKMGPAQKPAPKMVTRSQQEPSSKKRKTKK